MNQLANHAVHAMATMLNNASMDHVEQSFMITGLGKLAIEYYSLKEKDLMHDMEL